jgi:hypothetical protein
MTRRASVTPRMPSILRQTRTRPQSITLFASCACGRRFGVVAHRCSAQNLTTIAVSEAINLRIWATSLAPVVYLDGTVLFVVGLAIARSHSRWTRDLRRVVDRNGGARAKGCRNGEFSAMERELIWSARSPFVEKAATNRCAFGGAPPRNSAAERRTARGSARAACRPRGHFDEHLLGRRTGIDHER